MGDRLKIVTIRARNVHRAYTDTSAQTTDDDASLASLLPMKSDSVLFCMRRVAVLLKHTKNSSWDNLRSAHMLQWPLSKKVVVTVRPCTLTPNLSSLIVINRVLVTRQCSDMGQVRWKMYIYSIRFQPLCHLLTEIYQNSWKFVEVLTETEMHSFLDTLQKAMDRCFDLRLKDVDTAAVNDR